MTAQRGGIPPPMETYIMKTDTKLSRRRLLAHVPHEMFIRNLIEAVLTMPGEVVPVRSVISRKQAAR